MTNDGRGLRRSDDRETGAALHDRVVRRDALVGMSAVAMDEDDIGEQAIVRRP